MPNPRIGSGPEQPQHALDALTLAIHSAGGNEAEWPTVLERLRRRLDARVVTLGHHAFDTGHESPMFESPGDSGFSADLAAYAARNPWFLASGDYVPGRVLRGEDLIGIESLRRTDFYRGFLEPRGLLHRLCGVVAQRGTGAFLLSAYRGPNQAAFGAQEQAELGFLLGHVTLALNSQWRWQEASDLAQALLGLLAHDTQPTVLLSPLAEVVYRNPAAEALLAQGLGLRFDGKRLMAASLADQRVLREAVAEVAGRAQDGAEPPPRVVTLASAAPGAPMVAVLRHAGRMFVRELGLRRGLALLTVRGGHAHHDPAVCPFARQYELTAAQARVSALVFDGQGLATIARSLKVSENTVRSHLKQIYQKTDTHGQMDLVHLHARMCSSRP